MLGAVGRFFTGEASPKERAVIFNGAENGFAPYTKKMLDHNPKISVRWSKNAGLGVAALSRNAWTGKIKNMELGRQFKWQPEDGTAYLLESMAEHEAIHYDQSRYGGLQTLPLYTTPETAPQLVQILELEAYGRQLVKLRRDGRTGHAQEHDAHLVAQMIETPVKLMAQSLKAVPKDDECLLAEFYFNAAQLADSDFFSRQGDKASYMQREALLILNDPETLGLSRKALGVDTASVFSHDFGLEQARTLLGREGVDYISIMGKQRADQFWKNICRMSSSQQAAVQKNRAGVDRLLAK